jgi:hypothetical protein
MTNTMTKLPAVADLSPPASMPAVQQLLRTIVEFRDDAGHFDLRRELTTPERAALEAREEELGPWLAPGRKEDIAAEINRLRLAFGVRGESEREAMGVAMQYAVELGGMPLWAVKRACLRFGGGHVQPEEVGAKRIDWSFPPSSAMLRIVATKIVRTWGEERERLRRTLAGSPPRLEAPEPIVSTSVEAWLAAREKEKVAEKLAAGDGRMDAKAVEQARHDVLREYDRMGLVRPKEVPNKMLVSPHMLLRFGWTIEEVGGRRVLLAPAKVPA